MNVHIKTLGDFDMLIEGESIMQDSSRSYKLFKLFEYFLTFRNKKIQPEIIIENLWQDQDSMDPKNMIRGQIFRLRQILKDILPGEDYLKITFSNGFYTLEVGENVILDIDEMEMMINEGNKYLGSDKDRARIAYREAVNIYEGGYLAENHYEIWLVPVRNYYKRLFVKTIEKLVDLYLEKGEYEEIVKLTERAITVEPYEENIHKHLIESQLRLGKIHDANNHLQFMQIAFEKQMGIETTTIMRELEKKIKSYSIEKMDLTENDINKKLDLHELNGPLKCESEHFKLLYNSYKRRRKNEQEDIDYISLITFDEADESGLESWQAIMVKTLESTLRKGDVYTIWNDSQILILLLEVGDGRTAVIEERIKKTIKEDNGKLFKMLFKFIPIENKTDFNFND